MLRSKAPSPNIAGESAGSAVWLRVPDHDSVTGVSESTSRLRIFKIAKSELALRVCSALVLAPLAVAAAYCGSWPFALFWSAAAVGALYEWNSLIVRQRPALVTGVLAVALALGLAAAGYLGLALIVLVTGSLGTATLGPAGRRVWTGMGVLYATVLGAAPILLRSDLEYGFVAIMFLFAVVWATDTSAYVAGRIMGGPKLLPRVSPQKTWTGAFGGVAGAIIAALAVAELSNLSALSTTALAALLSVLAEAGDLFESFLKRRFNAKDSSGLIPGHGGLLDRLDGFIAAAFAAGMIGIVRGGFETPARGLLVW
jgi:phosphatidate cytidylyltransferase